jgi:deoxyribodipyrimidine photo-lyase
MGSAVERVSEYVEKQGISTVVCDFTPLRIGSQWLQELKLGLNGKTGIIQVDAHNIVPCWVASDKLEYAARTIRNKINSRLGEFLTEFPPILRHGHNEKVEMVPVDWEKCYSSL